MVRSSLLIRDGFAYAVGELIAVGARYLPAIVYPFFLDSEEYGIFVLATALTTAMGVLLSFGLKGAAFKQYFDYQTLAERKSLYGTLLIAIVLAGGACTWVVQLGLAQVFEKIFASVPFPYIRIALWTAYLTTFSILPLEILRAQRQSTRYLSLTVGNALTLVLLAWIFVAHWQLGIWGALLAPAITAGGWALVYLASLAPHASLKFSWPKLMSALAYSLPLVPHQIGHWLLNLSDRFVLERSVPLADVGVYGLGYNIGNVQQVVANAGNSVLMPAYGQASQDVARKPLLGGLFRDYVSWMALATLALSIFSDELVLAFFSPEFAKAATIAPWVALGFFCVSLYYGPMNAMTLLLGQTRWLWVFTVLAGLVNVGANLVFVPRLGIQAAAFNTLLGYLVLFGMMHVYSVRVSDLRYPWARITLICLGLLLGVVLDRELHFSNLWIETFSDVVILCVFAAAYTKPRILWSRDRDATATD